MENDSSDCIFNSHDHYHCLIKKDACGTCPFEDGLFILALTSVVIIFLEAHMIVRNVRMIYQTNSAIMQHSMQQSAPFASRIVPN